MFLPSSALSPVQHLSQKLSFKKLVAARAGRGMLIAIDPSFEQADVIASQIVSGAKILRLAPEQDSLEQITQTVCRKCTQSIHIFTRSSPGCLHFSSGDITLENLHYYAEQIESWFCYQPFYKGSKMKVQSNDYFLSLYADKLAYGQAGQDFVESLHHLSGVTIHTSTKDLGDKTTNPEWQLEVSYPFPHTAKTPFLSTL